MRPVAIRVLGHDGRMISSSKSAYRRARPTNIAVFNSHVAVAAGEGEVQNLWRGDLDLTLWEERLAALARLLDRRLYLFYECDGREVYDAASVERSLAIFHPYGLPLIPERTATYIARASDGTLRLVIPPDTRDRFRARVFLHRPRLWRFWCIETRKRETHDADGETSRFHYLGSREEGRSPLLVLATARRSAALEQLRHVELTWYPSEREGRQALRALIDLGPHLRVGRFVVWVRLIIWPAFMYELLVGFSRQRRDDE